MFYDTKINNHGLKHTPFKSCVIPRPIAWISTISDNKTINIAPFSYFNAICDIPPVIMFSSAHKSEHEMKDSMRNILASSEFVVNICSYEDREKMNQSSSVLDYGLSEADMFNIETVGSHFVKVPRIKYAKIAMECKFIKSEQLVIDHKPISSTVIVGHVLGIYIDDSIIEDGKINVSKLKPVARLGYDEFAVIESIFKMPRK